MDRGIYTVATAAIDYERFFEVSSNNLAGINVTGFKRDMTIFSVNLPKSEMYLSAPRLLERGFFHTQMTITDFSQGPLKPTDNPLDVAISGDGFFVVQTESGPMYTRRGDFILDNEGRLTTKDGYPVQGDGGVITLTGREVVIGEDGTITVDGEEIDRLTIVDFPKPYQLKKVGGGMFRPLNKEVVELPAEGVSVKQGHLEMSNINAIREMVLMIDALRAYESHTKLIKGFDDMTGSVIRLASTG